MRLIITRHGETDANVNKICIGHGDTPLNETGKKQAELLALRFEHDKLDAIYSSDLSRAMDTAKAILKFHSELNLNVDARIKERFLGDYEGKPFPPHFNWNELSDTVESNESLCKRAKEFLDDIYKKHEHETVLVVCHAGMKRALLGTIQELAPEEINSFEPLKNTSVSIFDIYEDKNNVVHLFNCTKHLE